MRKLPSLNALKAFEACARHCSFTVAGEELLVTQSAVSRQVKALEDYLGVQLFLRQPRKLALTRHGKALLPALTKLFDRLATVVSGIQQSDHELRIRLPPTFAIRWLIPRMRQFQEQNSDLEVLLSTGWNPVNFAKEDFDLGIVCGSNLGGYDETMDVQLIAQERLTPVCSPNMIRDDAPINEPRDLLRYTLLHGSEEHDFWRDWFEASGVEVKGNFRSQTFDLMDTSLHAAARGYGVALAPYQFVMEDLALKRLTMPFPNLSYAISAYYVVRPKGYTSQQVEEFFYWLLETTQAEWVEEPRAAAVGARIPPSVLTSGDDQRHVRDNPKILEHRTNGVLSRRPNTSDPDAVRAAGITIAGRPA